ncbi:GlsB/YeaQ/YmgE family stress response membrane protein [Actinomyces sp. Marseille-P3109]|uniref:GlsB/YeaQ/YmgE family stress response membrane protein n=1 Tax=Actinomyces sp. Marseille-P3109 TaxID=2083009 RepID=UPI000D55BFB8|nr:GlsB/YeaQ/YmgE family stress response membrane protein [Actinomyces sp. Marseille-P3109]
MFSIIGFVWTIVIGAVVGCLARLLLRGQQNISLLWTTVLGIVGAFIGDAAARSLGVVATSGIDWIRWGLSIVAAMIAISIYLRLTGKK